jgi:hypothetical protein
LSLPFDLYAEVGSDTWLFKATGGLSCDPEIQPRQFALRDRVRESLSLEHFSKFDPKKMFSSHCFCCGKGLTDPASMARFIGPECAQTGSLNIPGVLQLHESPYDAR